MKKLLTLAFTLTVLLLINTACTPEPDHYYYAIIEDDSGSRESVKRLGKAFYDPFIEHLIKVEPEVIVEYYQVTKSDPLPLLLRLPALPQQVSRFHPEYNKQVEALEQVIETRKKLLVTFFDSIQALPIVPAKKSDTYLNRTISRLPLNGDASNVAILLSTDFINHPKNEDPTFISSAVIKLLNDAKANGAVVASFSEADWSLIQDTLQLDITLLRHPNAFIDLLHSQLKLQNQ